MENLRKDDTKVSLNEIEYSHVAVVLAVSASYFIRINGSVFMILMVGSSIKLISRLRSVIFLNHKAVEKCL